MDSVLHQARVKFAGVFAQGREGLGRACARNRRVCWTRTSDLRSMYFGALPAELIPSDLQASTSPRP
jgi:hypothetical protein